MDKQQQYAASLGTKAIACLRTLCTDLHHTPTPADVATYKEAIDKAVAIWGDEAIAEPIRYLTVADIGLRMEDIDGLIGGDWDKEAFVEFNNALGFPLAPTRYIDNHLTVLALPLRLHSHLLDDMDQNLRHSLMTDVAYAIIALPENNPLRLLCGARQLILARESYELARFICTINVRRHNTSLRDIANAVAGDDHEARQCVFDTLRVTDVDTELIQKVLLFDVLPLIPDAAKATPLIQAVIRQNMTTEITDTNPNPILLYAIAKLRLAQNNFLLKKKTGVARHFDKAVSLIDRFFVSFADTITIRQLELIWNATTICCDMGHTGSVSYLFDHISTAWDAIGRKTKDHDQQVAMYYADIERRTLIDHFQQHLPEKLRATFKDYTPEFITRLRKAIDMLVADDATAASSDPDSINIDRLLRLSSYCQLLGNVYARLGQHADTCGVLTEAQIAQERTLGRLIKRDKEHGENMSNRQLQMRLILSLTNWQLAAQYRHMSKKRHDRKVMLDTNWQLNKDCLAAYPYDTRVIHFFARAAIELGEFYNEEKDLMAAGDLFTDALARLSIVQNRPINGQVAYDTAILNTVAGQTFYQLHNYKKSQEALLMAQIIWRQLYNDTHRDDIKQQLDVVNDLLAKL